MLMMQRLCLMIRKTAGTLKFVKENKWNGLQGDSLSNLRVHCQLVQPWYKQLLVINVRLNMSDETKQNLTLGLATTPFIAVMIDLDDLKRYNFRL